MTPPAASVTRTAAAAPAAPPPAAAVAPAAPPPVARGDTRGTVEPQTERGFESNPKPVLIGGKPVTVDDQGNVTRLGERDPFTLSSPIDRFVGDLPLVQRDGKLVTSAPTTYQLKPDQLVPVMGDDGKPVLDENGEQVLRTVEGARIDIPAGSQISADGTVSFSNPNNKQSWTLDPSTQSVTVHGAGKDPVTLEPTDFLIGPDGTIINLAKLREEAEQKRQETIAQGQPPPSYSQSFSPAIDGGSGITSHAVQASTPPEGVGPSIQSPVGDYGYIQPIDGIGKKEGVVVTSGFGPRESPGGIGSTNHKGIDIAAPTGTPAYSVADGVVVFAGQQGGYGNIVEVEHTVEKGGTKYKHVTQYAHLDTIYVTEGQTVKQGQPVGGVGSTGNSTGPHLHFGLKEGDQFLDPAEYIDFTGKQQANKAS